MCSFLDGILACLHFIPLHSLARDRSSPKLTCYAWEFMGKSSSESALIRTLMWKKQEGKILLTKFLTCGNFLFFQFTKRGHHNNSNNNNDSWKKRVQKGFLVPFSYNILARLTRIRIRSVLFFSGAWGFFGLPLFADIAALWVVCDHSEFSLFSCVSILTDWMLKRKLWKKKLSRKDSWKVNQKIDLKVSIFNWFTVKVTNSEQTCEKLEVKKYWLKIV